MPKENRNIIIPLISVRFHKLSFVRANNIHEEKTSPVGVNKDSLK